MIGHIARASILAFVITVPTVGGVAAVIEMGSWQIPPIFEHLQQLGNVPQDEMLRTFNMGLGMLLVVPSKKFKKAQTVLERAGEKAFTVGRIVKGDRKVMYS